ncbi:antibiotic biosynthesis monooxygenase family protein [Streptomyces sp. CO7]
MPGRRQETPLTVINRFTVRGDTGRFERAFREHSQYLRGRPDFAFLVTVRLVERPDVYVHLGHWRTTRGFLDTVHEDDFHGYVRKLGPMVDAEADQAVSEGRVLRGEALVGAENVVLTRARTFGGSDSSAFRRLFAETTEYFAGLDGFGGSDLLRSTLHPGTWTGVHWWRDTGDCERALAGRGHVSLLARMRNTADVEVERTRHVAYERLLS